MSSKRVCSICKSPGVTKSTCPLNKNAKNKNMKTHINAAKKIKLYLKQKETKKEIKKETKKDANKCNKILSDECPKLVVLDNDECLGQFGLFSSLYVYARMINDPYKINIEELKKACVKYLFPNGIARPYLLELFTLLKHLKLEKKIDGVIMYTSAPNNLSDGKAGYVYFLKDCIELYCNCHGIYDKVLHRNNIIARTSSCGATIKDIGNVLLTCQQRKIACGDDNYKKRKIINYINQYTKNIIMIDDKPNNIRNRSGKCIGISQYEYEGNSYIFKKCINSVFNLRKKLDYYRDPDNKQVTVYQGILKEADQNYKKYYEHKNNNSLIKIIKIIKKLYE